MNINTQSKDLSYYRTESKKNQIHLHIKGINSSINHIAIDTLRISSSSNFIKRFFLNLYAWIFFTELTINGDKLLLRTKTLAQKLLNTNKEIQAAKKNNSLFHLILKKLNAIFIENEYKFDLLNKVQIGTGGFGTVYKVSKIAKDGFAALKIPLRKTTKGSSHFIENEISVLNHLNREGRHPGLQSEPYVIVNIANSFGTTSKGYIGKLYTSDVFEWLKNNPSKEERFSYCRELMNAFYTFSVEKNVCHGDLKLENFFIDDIHPLIGDWGHAIHITTPEGTFYDNYKTNTPGYINNKDFNEQATLSEKIKKLISSLNSGSLSAEEKSEKTKEIEELKEEFKRIGQHRDLYAMYISLKEILGNYKEVPEISFLLKAMDIPLDAMITNKTIEDLNDNWQALSTAVSRVSF